MSAPQRRFKFARSARNLGVSALVAVTVTGFALYERANSAADLTQVTIASNAFANYAQQSPAQAPATAVPGAFQDGEYEGDAVQASRWGTVQVKAVIANGQLTDIKILDYPHSRSMSQRISQIAIPYLMEEAIQAQSASIDLISGATPTSQAFIASLQSALDDASAGATTPTTAGASV